MKKLTDIYCSAADKEIREGAHLAADIVRKIANESYLKGNETYKKGGKTNSDSFTKAVDKKVKEVKEKK